MYILKFSNTLRKYDNKIDFKKNIYLSISLSLKILFII